MKVLIVEDEWSSQQALQYLLRAHGFDADAVSTADQAVRALADADGFDVVLLDVDLPDRDGLELLEEVRDSHPRMRAVLVTGADSRRLAPATDRGIPYLPKPIDFHRLLAILREDAPTH